MKAIMHTHVYSIGRTRRTILYVTTWKMYIHKVVLFPDGSSESHYWRTTHIRHTG